MSWRSNGWLLLAGAVVAGGGDLMHVASGTTAYAPGAYLGGVDLLGAPLISPPLFACVGLTVGLAVPRLDRPLGWRGAVRGARDGARVAAGLAVFFLVYAETAWLPLATGGGRDLVVAATALALWAAADRRWQGLAQGAAVAAVGCAVEVAAVAAGAFRYGDGHGNVASVPSWLPWLYLAGAIAAGNLGRWAEAADPRDAADRA